MEKRRAHRSKTREKAEPEAVPIHEAQPSPLPLAQPIAQPAPAQPVSKPRLRMVKAAIALALVLVLAGGGYWLYQQPLAAPQASSTPSLGPTSTPVRSPPPLQALGKDRLVELALANSEVKAYAERNPAYFVEDRSLGQGELEAQAKRYPLIYANLSPPLYELRFASSSGEGMMVLLNPTGAQRVFALQSLRAGG